MGMRSLVLLLGGLALGALASCGRGPAPASLSADFAPRPEKLAPEAAVAAAKLREHCKACHAVGSMRFIWSESDAELWNSLFINRAPGRRVVWADAISEVLSWPSDAAPPSAPIMDPGGGRDWMPRGGKRLTFAVDTHNGETVRRVILRALREAGAEPAE